MARPVAPEGVSSMHSRSRAAAASLTLFAALSARAEFTLAQAGDKPVFLAGAASADITPPPWTAPSDAAFVPACGPSADAVSSLWPGERRYQFEEPYVGCSSMPMATSRTRRSWARAPGSAGRWASFESRPDPGTAGSALPYSVSTAGVILNGGKVVLIDVFGAQALLPAPTS